MTGIGVRSGGPGQRRAVRVGRIGGRQHHRGVVRPLGVHPVEIGAQPIHGGRDGELGAAQRLDEIAALAATGLLESGQHLVQGGETAGHPLGGHRALGQHTVAVQQQFGAEVGPQSRIGFRRGQCRPPAGHRRVRGPGLRVGHRVPAEPRGAALPVRGSGGPPRPGTTPTGQQRAHRGEGVAGDPTGPDQFPQSGFHGVLGAVGQLAEKEGAAGVTGVAEHVEDGPVGVGELDLGRRRQRQRRGVGVVERDPAVAAGDRPGPRPGDLAGGQQLVEHRGLVVGHPHPEHQRLDRRRRHWYPGELVDDRGQPVHAGARGAADLLPGRQETGVGRGADRFHLRAQRGQRAPPQYPQHLGVAPLLTTLGQVDELAAHQPAVDREAAQHVTGHPQPKPESGSGLTGRERPAGARIAAQ